MEKELNYKSLLRIVVCGILLYCGIQNYPLILNILAKLLHLVFPFLLGGAIAFIINVPMRKIEGQLFPNKSSVTSLKRILAYLITLILIIGILGLALFVIIPQISDTIIMIIDRVPDAFKSFQNWLYKITENMPNVQSYINAKEINWNDLSAHAIELIKNVSTSVFSSGISIVSGIVGGVTNFVVAFIFSIYILFQKERLSIQGKKVLYALFNEAKADRIIYIGRLSNKVFSNFLSGQCIEAVILGSMFFITLMIFRLPYAVLIGVVIAITALIPIFGAFIGCIIGAFLIVMVNPIQALWFVIIFLILQQIENNLIYPRVVGGSIGLPSMWVLVSVMVGSNLLGIAGILIFIPFCSVCYSLFRDYINKRLAAKSINTEKWETIPDIEIPEASAPAKAKKAKPNPSKRTIRKSKNRK